MGKEMDGGKALISVVVPCFNEEEVIEQTHRTLSAALSPMADDYEVLYVDDGSSDRTLELLTEISRSDRRAKVISFSRNFGHQAAVTAGIDHARGDAVVLIDADLQDPPSLIPEMVARWREGYHVVYGQRIERKGETPFKKWTASRFYRLMNKLSEVPIPLDTGDFRLMDRSVVDALKRMPEKDRFIRGMVSWVGFNQCPIRYERAERFAGTTKYPLRKMIRFAMDGLLSFSAKPLRIATTLGFVTSLLAMLGIVYVLFVRLFTSTWVSGWAFTMIAVLFIGGVQLISLGIIGEYVGRIYGEGKRRPLYLVKEAHGLDAPTQAHGADRGESDSILAG